LAVATKGLEGLHHFRVHAVDTADEIASPIFFLVAYSDADVTAQLGEWQGAQIGAGLGERLRDAAHSLEVSTIKGIFQLTDASDGSVEVQLGELGDQTATFITAKIEQRPNDEQIEDLLTAVSGSVMTVEIQKGGVGHRVGS
jgi:hypothetical protein